MAVQEAILGELETWLGKCPRPPLQEVLPNASHTLGRVYKTQETIGCHHFIRGRITREWLDLIRHELQDRGIPDMIMTPDYWGKQVITICWTNVSHSGKLGAIKYTATR
jgi:hypothetical protein